jgi:hypothetical protein
MGRDDDRPDYLDREKKSFSVLDRMRRERGSQGEARPRSPAGQARAGAAAKQYLKHVDALFSSERKGSEGEKRVREMLDARGTPGLADACRAYHELLGLPSELRHASCFLDSGDRDLVLVGLAALRALHEAGSLKASAGLRSQLRLLAEDPDDELAEGAEEILELV